MSENLGRGLKEVGCGVYQHHEQHEGGMEA